MLQFPAQLSNEILLAPRNMTHILEKEEGWDNNKPQGRYLWKGRITIQHDRDSTDFKYMRIYQNGIFICKDEHVSSTIQLIKYENLLRLEFPKIRNEDSMHTHFDGIEIVYTSDGKPRELYFWAKGFGQHLNIAEMKKLIRAIEKFQEINAEPEKAAQSENTVIESTRPINTNNHPTLENIPVDLLTDEDIVEHRHTFIPSQNSRKNIKRVDKLFFGAIGFFIGFIFTILSILLAATIGISAGFF